MSNRIMNTDSSKQIKYREQVKDDNGYNTVCSWITGPTTTDQMYENI